MKISIPQPCHENWNEMLPEEKGRFCLSCQKCVYDLTNSSDDEILNISKQKDICVRLNVKQIDRFNSNQNFILPNWLRYSSLLIAFGLSSLGFAQNKAELKYTTSQIEELIKKDTTITIKIQVIHYNEKYPIANAKVYLEKKKKKYSTKTDENGYFELKIPTKYLNESLIIENKNGYLDYDYKVSDILNENRIEAVDRMMIGRIEFKNSKSIAFLNRFNQFFI